MEPAFEDLTAQARIRDAALRLFGERGVEGTTIRDIARAAGVSGGLIRHHFGSKEDLRAACDAYALKRLVEIKEQAILQGQIANPGFLASAQPAVVGLLQYFARSMADGSPAAASMFDEMVTSPSNGWPSTARPGSATGGPMRRCWWLWSWAR